MGMPALKLKFEEVSVEERLARLESSVENIQTNVAEMRVDIRRLNDKFDTLKDAIATLTLSTERTISKLTLWAVTLYIGLAVMLLTVLARSLHWL
jgi:predicted nuclease with TOPRIM domain